MHIVAGPKSTVVLLNWTLQGIGQLPVKGGCTYQHLHNNLSPKKLNISNCGLEDSSSAALIEMLSCNKSLIELTIGESVIHEAGP